ncbi:hypothetical protein RchiOBHm_Chr1g0329521 [Rosa chinensis]|uniref:Uncharacterized protein n=1 Tax=Rosa chinensis TaxID=74649 RepID=A0A2P6SB12_ROSCH|nr:hypothetical protein RchiOBHm_Chr1g0329521 [Rosa chinensis]
MFQLLWSVLGRHWYTVPGGRKVYVGKTGQELTGQTAHRLCSKES